MAAASAANVDASLSGVRNAFSFVLIGTAMLPPRSRYTPRNRSELVACLIGLGETRTVKVATAAGELLRPYEVSTVKDVLDLPTWPYGRLRIVIEQRPLMEVIIEPV